MMTFHDSCKRLDGETDGALSSYFTQTKAIEELAAASSEHVVAVGLKGIGKSSAFRYLTEFSIPSEDVVIGINSDKFTLHLPNKDLHYSTCRKQFEHDIVQEALRGITTHKATLARPQLKHLVSKARNEVNAYLEAVREFAGRFNGISLLGVGFTLAKADAPVLVGLRQDRDVASALETLRSICASGVRVRIVVDDPEQVFSAGRVLDTHLIGGFCLAAIRLAQAIPNLKIIALLKTHIYQPVLRDVDDMRKYPDHMSRLQWTADELVQLVERRLRATKTRWTDVFEGSEAQGQALVSNDMAKVSRNGPRDLIHHIDLALRLAGSGKLGPKELQRSRRDASVDSLGELESAYSSQYPSLGDVVRAIFRDSPQAAHDLRKMALHVQTLLIKDPDMKALSRLRWMQHQTSQTLPNLLFETGVLALECKGAWILPYEKAYTSDAFKGATTVRLVPALVDAVGNV